MQSATGGKVNSMDASVYDLGIDWITPYNSTQHSIGLIFIRCADVDPRNKGKCWNQHVIAIIAGPKAPETIDPIMRLIASDFLRLQNGMQVTEAWPGENGVTHSRTFVHLVFLGVVMADTPARAKVCNGNGQNSYVGACTWCVFQGSSEGGTIRFLGYREPVRQTFVAW